MPVADLLLEGVKLMVLGMGTVFVFLMLLVVTMMGMSRLARTLGSDDPSVESEPAIPAGSNSPEEQELIAIISVAVRQYRSTHR